MNFSNSFEKSIKLRKEQGGGAINVILEIYEYGFMKKGLGLTSGSWDIATCVLVTDTHIDVRKDLKMVNGRLWLMDCIRVCLHLIWSGYLL